MEAKLEKNLRHQASWACGCLFAKKEKEELTELKGGGIFGIGSEEEI